MKRWISLYCILHVVKAQISSLIQSMPTIQTGYSNCSYDCLVQFTQAFTESPYVGVILISLKDSQKGNAVYGIANYNLPLANISLTSFQLKIGQSSSTTLLSFSWIASSNKDIFIKEIKMKKLTGIYNYPPLWQPQNIGELKSFILMRGGYSMMGGNANSSIGKFKAVITINLSSWDLNQPINTTEQEIARFTLIVVNIKSPNNKSQQIRALYGQLQWANQTFYQINTIPVKIGQKQNMLIGLNSYCNHQSDWNFELNQIFINESSITQSTKFNSQSSVLLQYLQLELFVCQDVNSVFSILDDCSCNSGYHVSLYSCLKCDNSCSGYVTQNNNYTSCQPNYNRYQSGNSCLCQIGYYENNQANCSKCDETCFTCIGGGFNQCSGCDFINKHRTLHFDSCNCDTGYFLNTQNNQCYACDESCYQCTGSLHIQCTECFQSSFLNSFNSCQACDSSCFQCFGASNQQCTACNSTIQHRVMSAASCLCETGFYQGFSQDQCQVCNYTCLNCSHSNSCDACDKLMMRQQLGALCICQNGYYDNFTYSQMCSCKICSIMNLECHSSCYQCNGPTNESCILCDGNVLVDQSGLNFNSQRIFFNNSCLCQQRTYQDLNLLCERCHYSCLDCDGPSMNQCLTCIDQIHPNRIMDQGRCLCENGYYDLSNQAICQQCNPRCKACDGKFQNNCSMCYFQEQHRQLIQKQCICIFDYLQQSGQSICIRCVNQCIRCPKGQQSQQYLDKNCSCNHACVNTYTLAQQVVTQLNQSYQYLRTDNIQSSIVDIIVPIGILTQFFNSPQMILTTFLLDTKRPQSVFLLQRSLSLFAFVATISVNQSIQNDTYIDLFHLMDVTNASIIHQKNLHMRLVGFSEIIIYTAMPQLIMMGAIFTVLLIFSVLQFLVQGIRKLIGPILRLFTGFGYQAIEGGFLTLFTQILMNIQYMFSQNPSDLYERDFILSLALSVFILIAYLIHLTKISYAINSHMMNKIALIESQEQESLYDTNQQKSFVRDHKFYLLENPMLSKSQAQYTVLCQFKKFLFSLIIVCGQGQLDLQFYLFIILGIVYFVYALLTFPYKNKGYHIHNNHHKSRIGIVDLLMQFIFVAFIVLSFQDYLEVQDFGYEYVSGTSSFILILLILFLDLVKAIFKLVQMIKEYKIKKIKQSNKKLMDIQQEQENIRQNIEDYLSQQSKDSTIHDNCADYMYGEDPLNQGKVMVYQKVGKYLNIVNQPVRKQLDLNNYKLDL